MVELKYGIRHKTEMEDSRRVYFFSVHSCEIIRDWKTGESLCYAFIEFEKVCVQSVYRRMRNMLQYTVQGTNDSAVVMATDIFQSSLKLTKRTGAF